MIVSNNSVMAMMGPNASKGITWDSSHIFVKDNKKSF